MVRQRTAAVQVISFSMFKKMTHSFILIVFLLALIDEEASPVVAANKKEDLLTNHPRSEFFSTMKQLFTPKRNKKAKKNVQVRLAASPEKNQLPFHTSETLIVPPNTK